jgi:cation-transporting ATPase F
MLGITALVTAVGLPLVVSALFAIGETRMARRNALIRRLPAGEALGAAAVIGSDKTGTLTRNQMTVTRVSTALKTYEVSGHGYDPAGTVTAADGSPSRDVALDWLALVFKHCNDALLEEAQGDWQMGGDPTEGALLVLAHKLGVGEAGERGGEIPFSAERKWMATLHRLPGGEHVALVKGAAERLFPMATGYMDGAGAERPWDEQARLRAESESEEMARAALRVLALGVVRGIEHPESLSEDYLHGRLVVVGLTGMIDPPRQEAIPAVRTCQEAGIQVVMITGDHRETALAIARQIGIASERSQVRTGADIETMGEAELRRDVLATRVYARFPCPQAADREGLAIAWAHRRHDR